MKKILIILSIIVIAIALVFLAPYFVNTYYDYKSLQGETSKYPSTYFIKPSNSFVSCYKDDDCLKVKGSACQPSNGGVETCINKNYMQEYLSSIDNLAGKEWEVECPNINNTTNRTCSCVNNVCNLVSL
jgi:hypothetical protein